MQAKGISVTVVLLVSCAPQQPTDASPSALPTGVVARWDGGTISADEVRSAAGRLPIGLKEQYGTPNGLNQFVDAVIAQRLLREEAARRGLAQREDIRRQVTELEDRLTVQALVTEAERSLGPPTEAELRAYFDQHQDEFKAPAKVRVTRVLLLGKSSDKALRSRAEDIRRRLQSHEPPESVATRGEGPERIRKGDLGWITEPTDPETTMALALRVGEVSPVIESNSGLSVILVTERQDERVPPFEELRETLAGRITATRQRRAFDTLVQRLRAEAQVQINPVAFQ